LKMILKVKSRTQKLHEMSRRELESEGRLCSARTNVLVGLTTSALGNDELFNTYLAMEKTNEVRESLVSKEWKRRSIIEKRKTTAILVYQFNRFLRHLFLIRGATG
jgi:hypothetical protein